ncbi:MAG: hypothetical protein L0229_14940 [Blastocatellia bacterium]|nr:hypothetical protein [Blastocatellia bacterium]
MSDKSRMKERGFTVLELGVVVLLVGITAAISVPQIVNAMREYRLNSGLRQIADTLKRAKMQAVSANQRTALSVDPTGRRIGMTFFNDDNTVNRTEWVPLPSGVSFERPTSITSNPEGVTTQEVLSFPQEDGVYRLSFNTRGFPIVAFGDTSAIFIGNGRNYRAITMSSVGGVRTYRAEDSIWVNTRRTYESTETETETTPIN